MGSSSKGSVNSFELSLSYLYLRKGVQNITVSNINLYITEETLC